MMRRKTIAFDLDDTLAMTNLAVLTRVNKTEGTHFQVSDIQKWDYSPLTEQLGVTIDYFHQFLQTPCLYDIVKPYPGVKFLVQMLSADYDLVVVTSSFRGTETAKSNWVDDWFSGYFQEVIHCRDKSRIRCDLLIDDRPQTIEKFWELGLPILPVEQTWNKYLLENENSDRLNWETNRLGEAERLIRVMVESR